MQNRDDDALAARVTQLEGELERMAKHLAMLEDVQAIRKLQHAYGYYLDKGLYEQVVDLFAEDGEVVFMGGLYKGKAGQRRLYIENFRKRFVGGREGPRKGLLLDHVQLQDIIDVAPDRRSAEARFRCFMQAGTHESTPDLPSGLPLQWWEGGIYENTYRRENDVWKIQRLNYHVVFQGSYEAGWRRWQAPQRVVQTFPENPTGPDELLANSLPAWPETPVVPFHYAHPVTGKRWTAGG